MSTAHRYFVVHKPPQMVSQFVSSHQVRLLGDLAFSFPEGTHAIGRLDADSEGLLLLTTNKRVTKLLFQGEMPHGRTYLVKVKFKVSDATLQQLRSGVSIRVQGGGYYTTAPCVVEEETTPERFIPLPDKDIRQTEHSWLRITLTEGKFHQVRKMVKAMGHPCLRLIRLSIEDLHLNGLPQGAVREIAEADFFESLRIKYPQTV